jgi:hypothetical protein
LDGMIPVDSTHVIVLGQDGLLEAISLADETVVQVPTDAWIQGAQVMVSGCSATLGSSYVLDGSWLYVVGCEAEACQVARANIATSAVEMGPLLPGPGQGNPWDSILAAADETHLYLLDTHRIWRLRKTDYASEEIYRAPQGDYVYGPLAVDDDAVYFVVNSPAASTPDTQLVALDKHDASLRVVYSDPRLHGREKMVQDEQFLFLLLGPGGPTGDNAVWLIPKH